MAHFRPLAGVIIAAAVTAAGCAPAAPGGGSSEGTVTMSVITPIDSLDPTVAYQTGGFSVMANVFQTLLTLDAAGNVEPGLATEYDLDPVGQTIKFQLDPEATFSNGEPVTSEDVKFSVDYWKRGATYGAYYTSIDNVQTPDPHTAVFELSSTGVGLLGLLAVGTSSILPADFTGLSAEEFFRKPVGSGPYEITSAQLSEEIDLAANTHYKGSTAPQFTRALFKVIPDANQRLVQFQSGQLDIVGEISPNESRQFPAESLQVGPSFLQNIVLANVRNESVSDPRLRQAISLAIDREALVASVYQDLAVPGTTVEPQTVNNVAACDSCDWSRRDVEAARRLAADAGYTGAPISVLSGGGSTDLAAQALVPMLAEAGINITVEKVEAAVQSDRMIKGEYELLLISNTALAPTPLDPLGFLASSDNYYTGDDTAAATEAVAMLNRAVGDAELQAASRRYEEWAYTSASIIPLVSVKQVYAVQSGIAGFEPPVGLAFSVAPLSRQSQ